MQFSIDDFYTWLDTYEIDLDEASSWLETLEPDEDGMYTAPDNDGNKIPDFLDGLITPPVVTNPSQGGALG